MSDDSTPPTPTSFLEESPGVKSSSRLFQALAFATCVALPMVVWTGFSIHAGKMLPIDNTITYFCIGMAAIFTGGKAAQSIFQKQ